MSKITGKGGTITDDLSNVSNLVSFSFEEVEGNIRGQKGSNISATVILDSATTPYRQGDTFDIVMKPSSSAAWDISVTDVRVDSVSIAVDRASVITQELKITGHNTATIA
jgi:hypothetical protein